MLAQAEEAAWWDAWAKLKETIARLDKAVVNLEASRSYAMARPNLRPEFERKMAEVESMKSKALWLRDNIKQAMATFGVELSGLASLGFLPALVWPAVAAGVAWLGSKALDLYQFSQRIDEQRRLEASGMTPAAAAQLVTRTAEAGTLTGMLKAALPVLVVGGLAFGAWYFARKK